MTGPKKYRLKELIAQCDPDAPIPDELREWDEVPAVGMEQAMPLRTFIDVEASGLDMRESYPIEVAWVDSMGNSDSILIQPAPTWLFWDHEAEAVHGISRDTLFRRGHPLRQVAERINNALGMETVYSDAPNFDGRWIDFLFQAAELERDFNIVDLRILYSEIGAIATDRFHERISREAPTHRAEADARRYALAYRYAIAPADGFTRNYAFHE